MVCTFVYETPNERQTAGSNDQIPTKKTDDNEFYFKFIKMITTHLPLAKAAVEQLLCQCQYIDYILHRPKHPFLINTTRVFFYVFRDEFNSRGEKGFSTGLKFPDKIKIFVVRNWWSVFAPKDTSSNLKNVHKIFTALLSRLRVLTRVI